LLPHLLPNPGVGQILVPIDTNRSTLQIELCVTPPALNTKCDSETHPLQGSMLVALDDPARPASIALHDFDAQAMADFNLRISYTLLGTITANARNLRIYHARPGPTNAPAGVTNGQFAFRDVPVQTVGVADYNISGLLCTALGDTFPCSTNIDMSALGENTMTNVPGTIVVSNGLLQILLDLAFSTPLDEDTPDLGWFNGHAVVRGAVPLLGISALGTNALLSWPSAATGCQLYRAGRFEAGTPWTPVGEVPSDNGVWKSVLLPMNGMSAFYRLGWP
jgi:hypothetical protein